MAMIKKHEIGEKPPEGSRPPAPMAQGKRNLPKPVVVKCGAITLQQLHDFVGELLKLEIESDLDEDREVWVGDDGGHSNYCVGICALNGGSDILLELAPAIRMKTEGES